MEFVTNQALISINGTIFVQLISFLIFLFIFNRLIFRPLRKTVAARIEYIEKTRQDINAVKKEFVELLQHIEKRKSAVRDEAFALNIELEAQANKEAEEILIAARQEIETLRAAAERDINEQISEAKKHIQKESESLVVNIMEHVLNRRLVA